MRDYSRFSGIAAMGIWLYLFKSYCGNISIIRNSSVFLFHATKLVKVVKTNKYFIIKNKK